MKDRLDKNDDGKVDGKEKRMGRDLAENRWDRKEDVRDRKEDVRDRKEDKRDRREDVRDRKTGPDRGKPGANNFRDKVKSKVKERAGRT